MAGLQPNHSWHDGKADDGRGDTASSKSPLEVDQPLHALNQPDSTQKKAILAEDDEAWAAWVYPPQFYDRLSRVHLTEGALAEHDRRNRNHLSQYPPRPSRPQEDVSDLLRAIPGKSLAQSARHGGLDLMGLCNYPPPPAYMLTGDEKLLSKATTQTEHDVNPIYKSQTPTNRAEIQSALNRRRPSLVWSQFSEDAFNTFRYKNIRATDEGDVMVDIVPTLLGQDGPYADRQELKRNLLFNNLAPLTDNTISPPKPDIYDGAPHEELLRSVRDALGGYIVPSTVKNRPLAPNFFMEVKGPFGTNGVGNRQVCYDGAIGSRAMHWLQNYGEEKLKYDGRAFTFSSLYTSPGMLQLFAHHITSPISEGGRPGYHMTKIRGFDMTDSHETFVQGATALRNIRDLAQQYRDTFIQSANDAERKRASLPRPGLDGIGETQEGDDGEGEEAAKEGDQEGESGSTPLHMLPLQLTPTASTARQTPTKRQNSWPLPEWTGPLTRAAERRRYFPNNV